MAPLPQDADYADTNLPSRIIFRGAKCIQAVLIRPNCRAVPFGIYLTRFFITNGRPNRIRAGIKLQTICINCVIKLFSQS
jgi:hypothetical protein